MTPGVVSMIYARASGAAVGREQPNTGRWRYDLTQFEQQPEGAVDERGVLGPGVPQVLASDERGKPVSLACSNARVELTWAAVAASPSGRARGLGRCADGTLDRIERDTHLWTSRLL